MSLVLRNPATNGGDLALNSGVFPEILLEPSLVLLQLQAITPGFYPDLILQPQLVLLTLEEIDVSLRIDKWFGVAGPAASLWAGAVEASLSWTPAVVASSDPWEGVAGAPSTPWNDASAPTGAWARRTS